MEEADGEGVIAGGYLFIHERGGNFPNIMAISLYWMGWTQEHSHHTQSLDRRRLWLAGKPECLSWRPSFSPKPHHHRSLL